MFVHDMEDAPSSTLIDMLTDILSRRMRLLEQNRCPYCRCEINPHPTLVNPPQHTCRYAQDVSRFHSNDDINDLRDFTDNV